MDRIIIVGGSSAIGRSIAERAAKRGVQPFLIGRDEAKLAGVAAVTNGEIAIADVLDEAALASAIKNACEGASIVGLAYCVGSIDLKPLRSLTGDAMVQAFRLNAVAPAIAVREAAAALKVASTASAQPSSIVLFSTVAVAQGFASHTIEIGRAHV